MLELNIVLKSLVKELLCDIFHNQWLVNTGSGGVVSMNFKKHMQLG